MKQIIKKHLLALLAVPAFVLTVSAAPVFAASTTDLTIGGGAGAAQGDDQSACLFGNEPGCDAEGATPIFKIITNVLLFIIGAVSVIMLIIGGIKYTVSQGDSTAITSAKNTILYSIIGLIVAILAYAAINFVIGSFVGGSDA
ncbi:hypothetical protein EOL96_02830 [Candidatus Saccharibacteria bacterium]|nr:hypothetical protein [Candidatus Saccharibacteria bacterium]